MIPCFVLAAGMGTRLRPLTDACAKPLVPIGDRPALAHVLERLRPVASRIVANAHYRHHDLEAFVRGPHGSGVTLSLEDSLLGTAGGLEHAALVLGDGDVVVWNGDTLSTFDPGWLVEPDPFVARSGVVDRTTRRDDRPVLAWLAVVPKPRGEGNVGLDLRGNVVRLRKETTAEGEIQGGDFMGIHRVGAELRRSLPSVGCLVGDVYLPVLRAGKRLAAVLSEVPFYDFGDLPAYVRANARWRRARHLDSFVAESASVPPSVDLVESIVGERSAVHGSGVLRRVIVWPDTTVHAPLDSVVATPFGIVPFEGNLA
ncbi:MAG: sugar phosphate nucleotidyltransferase [Polyangiaceae bacterium]